MRLSAWPDRTPIAALPLLNEVAYPQRVEAIDIIIPEIIRGAVDWIEDRYGRFAGRMAFVGLSLVVPLLAAVVVLAFLMSRRG